MHDFAANLKRLRVEAGLSREELAREIGVSSLSVARWERAQAIPQRRQLRAVAAYFDAWDELDLVRPSTGPYGSQVPDWAIEIGQRLEHIEAAPEWALQLDRRLSRLEELVGDAITALREECSEDEPEPASR
jgi:transcriptional regulator with XRE-family HTH domain